MTPIEPVLSLSLNGFIRIYAMDPAQQITEVARRMQKSAGYDFYRNLNLAIQAHINKKSQDEIEYILNNSSRPDEIFYNKSAFNIFIKRFGKKRKISIFDKKGSATLANGKVVVKVSPAFMLDSAGVMEVFHVWPTQNPKIDKMKANCAIYIIQNAFKKIAPNYQYKFFDAVSDKVYSGTSNTSGMAVENIAENIAKWASM